MVKNKVNQLIKDGKRSDSFSTRINAYLKLSLQDKYTVYNWKIKTLHKNKL